MSLKKSSSDKELLDLFGFYISEHHMMDLVDILQKKDTLDHYSITINFLSLFEFSVELGDRLLKSPIETLKLLDEACIQVASKVHRESNEGYFNSLVPKKNIHCRVTGLPVCPELVRTRLPKCSDVGNFLCITGTVIRTGTVKLLEFKKFYMCIKCKHVFQVEADYEQYYTVCSPSKCPNSDSCNRGFVALEEKGASPENCRNFQEVKVQEQAGRLKVGTVPRSLWVVLLDDLVDCCKPGDDVNITGVVSRRWRPLYKDRRCNVELSIRANHVQVTNMQKNDVLLTNEMKESFYKFWEENRLCALKGRDLILSSVCPQIYGMHMVKLALLLVLIGGNQRVDESGTKVRGESHLLLVGDPGTGKSQMMKYACRVMPRSILTTGVGCTSAGLTVTAVQDSGEWQLEAGALVLADGGICCIDEFNSIQKHDRASIHEAMEQQTISVAKAGLVCKLNTRCSVIACTNPKGQYDINESISVNTAIATPLLSRFDVVLVLLDSQNPEWDQVVSSHILMKKYSMESVGVTSSVWSIEKMRAYLSFVKLLLPTLSNDAMRIMSEYYKAQRKSEDVCHATRTTMRLLESLVRLSQAHAKLMMRDEVTVQDAVMAVTLMEATMLNNSQFIDGSNTLHMTFPTQPQLRYQNQAKQLLERLKLLDVLKRETERWNGQPDVMNNINNNNKNNNNNNINNNINNNNNIIKLNVPENDSLLDDGDADNLLNNEYDDVGIITDHPSMQVSPIATKVLSPGIGTPQNYNTPDTSHPPLSANSMKRTEKYLKISREMTSASQNRLACATVDTLTGCKLPASNTEDVPTQTKLSTKSNFFSSNSGNTQLGNSKVSIPNCNVVNDGRESKNDEVLSTKLSKVAKKLNKFAFKDRGDTRKSLEETINDCSLTINEGLNTVFARNNNVNDVCNERLTFSNIFEGDNEAAENQPLDNVSLIPTNRQHNNSTLKRKLMSDPVSQSFTNSLTDQFGGSNDNDARRRNIFSIGGDVSDEDVDDILSLHSFTSILPKKSKKS